MKKSLPVGVDNFEDLITNEYYYVDKTLFIKELLDLKGKVNLFTRPRRFGKTLNLSMLRYFFEDTGKTERNAHNRALFEPMKIMSAGSAYTGKMGSFPVINLTLKSAKQATFEEAYYQMKEAVMEEFDRHNDVVAAGELNSAQREKYEQIQEIIKEQLENTISFYDSAENFYHGFLAGILSQHGGYVVKSNRETGDGRCDLMIYPPNLEKKAFVLEFKVSKTFEETNSDAEKAVRQMEEKNYTKELEQMGYRDIVSYGVAFYRKNCKVRLGK